MKGSMPMKGFLLLIFTLGAIMAHASGQSEDSLANGPLNIVVSTNILGDVVNQIVGERANVTVLIQPGENPHSYQPSPRDAAQLEMADMIFVNGHGLESGILDLLEDSTAHVIEVSGNLDPEIEHDDSDLHEEHGEDDHHDEDMDDHDEEMDHHEEEMDDHESHDEHDHGDGDPHFWQSPRHVVHWTEVIEEALVEADSAQAEAYHQAAVEYRGILAALDAEVEALVARVPEQRRYLVTDHHVLGHFAHDYGFTEVGAVIPSSSDQSDASARQIAKLVELLQELQVPAIFVGETAGRGVQELIKSLAAEVGDVKVVPILTGSLAQVGQRGDSYEDFVRVNAERISESLR
ncbi:MAG: metal ABC transporter substrate-binding protein [Spirochaetales bacterium]|nr:metal ABC transporter substrate-binding protein [Spirochaetales bacterium]